ncbi:hypothetical protein Sjap_017687 [Stephania japonica]|uniref:Uncharacterized protein n=1 Tax=Stephania japonica TaxID=461633 RepID=A0AAP0NII7_9MAGN
MLIVPNSVVHSSKSLTYMENTYLGSNILVVTLTNDESKRVEVQSEKEMLREAIGVLRDIFGLEVPTTDRIPVLPWWNNHFQRESYNNYPIFATHQDFVHIKNRLDEGQVGMIAVSSEGEVAMFRGCATEDGFMKVGIWE